MTAPQLDRRLDHLAQRLGVLSGAVPYALLAVATTLALLEPGQQLRERGLTLGLAAVAAGWIGWFVTLHPEWAGRRGRMALYCAGLLLLITALMTRSTWFGLFAFTGYLHTWHLLHGGWRLLGVAATAALSAAWQTGGLPEPTVQGIATYLIFVSLIVVLVAIFSSVGQVTAAQSDQRRRALTELAAANARLEAALAENAGLQAQVLAQAREAGVLDERRRMAGEIHDTLAQNLAGIVTQLEAAQQAPAQTDRWSVHLAQARDLARASLAEARRSVEALRPAPLEHEPLPAALGALAQEWAARSGVALQVATTGQPQPLVAEIETALFRAAQEALANVAKHAAAARVGITLSYMDDVVLLDVRDDGAGFDPDRLPAGAGVGLRAMRQRLRRVAGELEVESSPGAGTALNVRVPAIGAEHRA